MELKTQPQRQNPQPKSQEDEPIMKKPSSSLHVKRPIDHIDHQVVCKNKKRKICTREKTQINVSTQVHKGSYEEEETQDFSLLFPRLCAFIESEASSYLKMLPGDSEKSTKEIICALGKDRAKEMEEGWKAFHVVKYQMYAKRVQLIGTLTEAMSDVIKHSNIRNLRG